MPSVDPNSVRFTNMAADPSAWVHHQTAKACLHFSSSAFVVGAFERSNPTVLQKIYYDASDYGQYNKLKLYNSLLQEIGGLD